MNSSTNLVGISVAKVKKFEPIDCYFTSNFADGKSDGENNFEPILYQWYNSDYRRGYLLGMSKRISNYTQVNGIKVNNIVSVY